MRTRPTPLWRTPAVCISKLGTITPPIGSITITPVRLSTVPPLPPIVTWVFHIACNLTTEAPGIFVFFLTPPMESIAPAGEANGTEADFMITAPYAWKRGWIQPRTTTAIYSAVYFTLPRA